MLEAINDEAFWIYSFMRENNGTVVQSLKYPFNAWIVFKVPFTRRKNISATECPLTSVLLTNHITFKERMNNSKISIRWKQMQILRRKHKIKYFMTKAFSFQITFKDFHYTKRRKQENIMEYCNSMMIYSVLTCSKS